MFHLLLLVFLSSLELFPYTRVLISTQLMTKEEPSADFHPEFSLCAALSSATLCPVNSSCLGLPRFSTAPAHLREYAGLRLGSYPWLQQAHLLQAASWGNVTIHLFPFSQGSLFCVVCCPVSKIRLVFVVFFVLIKF